MEEINTLGRKKLTSTLDVQQRGDLSPIELQTNTRNILIGWNHLFSLVQNTT